MDNDTPNPNYSDKSYPNHIGNNNHRIYTNSHNGNYDDPEPSDDGSGM